MDDLISRQAAIEAIEFGITYAKAINKETGEVTPMFESENKALEDAVERIRQLPAVDEYDVVEEYCRKRCLVIMTSDLFEQIKREYGGAQWIR